MNNFHFYNPTRLIFGEGTIAELQTMAPQLGERILLVYGGGSIRKNGVYLEVTNALQTAGIEWRDFGGIEPNPRHSTINQAIMICKSEKISGILAIGGGSVLDGAKAIAAGACYDGDVWDLVTQSSLVKAALPLGTVLTLAATGSEMNANSVITNWEINEKIGWSSPHTFPRFSILDPRTTCSVPLNHTIYGMVDIMSHVLEQYLHHQANTPVQDGIAETILRTMVSTAPLVLAEPNHLGHRATVMYSGTMALNGILSMGVRGDWATHNLEHAVSAIYDIPHGAGLAILFPQWMRYAFSKGIGLNRLAQLGRQVFRLPDSESEERQAEAAIDALAAFWQSLGAPTKLTDFDIGTDQHEAMAERTMRRGPFGRFITLEKADVLNIYQMS